MTEHNRLQEMICERLAEEHSIDANDVDVSVQGGRVTLEGTIDSRLARATGTGGPSAGASQRSSSPK